MKKKLKYGLVLILVIVMIFGYRLFLFYQSDDTTINLDHGIVIEKIQSYDGPFVEDGSDKDVNNVWSLVIKNTGNEDIEYLKINAIKNETIATFEVTCLCAGAQLIVLEKDGQKYDSSKNVDSYTIENIAFYQQERSLYTDIFELSASANILCLKNKSDKDISNTIYVYYKIKDDNIFKGGITYRVAFQDGIKAGEEKKVQSIHYNSETSEIMNLTYQ